MDIKKRLSGWMALAIFATIGGAGGAMVAADPAFAKVDVDKLTIDGEIRVRYEIRENGSFSSIGANQTNESAASHRVRIGVGYDLTPDVSFYAQIQDARIWGSEGAPFGGTGNAASSSGIGAVSSQNSNGTGVDLHQAYIQLKNVLVPGLGLKIGRQEIYYGDHRLLGNFGWSQVGNSFDAAKIQWSSEMVDADLFWARIFDQEVAGGCVGTGNNNCSGVVFNTNGTHGTPGQDLYGAYVTLKVVPNWTIEPYYYLLQDTRAAGTTGVANSFAAVPQAPDQSRNILGGRVNGKQGVGGGTLDSTVEADWQFGGISSNTVAANPQLHDLHINAWQGAARAGYTFDQVPMRPRLGIEADYASGDNCRHSGAAGAQNCSAQGHWNTADNLYPTNHGLYSYMDLMAWKNMVRYTAVFDVKPTASSKLQFNFSIDRLANHLDDWYRAGQVVYGSTNAANQSSSIGRELDVHYWHTFKEKFLFEIGYGHFWAGEYITSNQGLATGNNINGAGNGASTGSGQNWGYVMGSVKF